MAASFLSPVLAGSALAVAFGVYLGESAVALIDPIHFQGPAIHPRDRGAAIDPAARPRPELAFGDLYGWEEGQAAFARDCGDCQSLLPPLDSASLRVPDFASLPDPPHALASPSDHGDAAPALAIPAARNRPAGAGSTDKPGDPGGKLDEPIARGGPELE